MFKKMTPTKLSKIIKVVAVTALATFFAASCAQSPKKVSLPSDINVQTAIEKGDRDIRAAYMGQWDILAYDELQKSEKHLKNAKEYNAAGKSQEKIVEQLELFQTYYDEAETLSSNRMSRVQGLLTARESVLNSGVRSMDKESKQLTKLDDDFRDLAKENEIDVKEFAKLQANYLELTAQAKKNNSLANARRQIQEAIDNRARRHAPVSLNIAEVDLKSAENMIDANQSKPDAYQASIDKVNRSAAYLTAVVAEQKRSDWNLDENSARRMVNQKNVMARMDAELAAQRSQLESSRAALINSQMSLESAREQDKKMKTQLTEQERALAQAQKEKQLQQALESARKQFSPGEAEVFRQGDKLLLRLKGVGFATGAAAIPEKSKVLLDKVSSVAQELSPKEVVIEGHTDSTGSAEVNNELSQKRADSVASYLKHNGISENIVQSVGLGYQKPLTTNKTKTGRAQNRRVDVWITPENMPSTATE